MGKIIADYYVIFSDEIPLKMPVPTAGKALQILIDAGIVRELTGCAGTVFLF